jgi:arylsulfatase A-like enzyme
VAVLLDLAAVFFLGRLLVSAAAPGVLTGFLAIDDPRQAVRWTVAVLLLRILVEPREAAWIRIPGRLARLGQATRTVRGPVRLGAAGGGSAAFACVVAWSLRHPRTDYPDALALGLAALVLGTVGGGALGIVTRAIARAALPVADRFAPGASARAALVLAVGGAVWAGLELDPALSWSYPIGAGPGLAALVGVGAFLAALAFLAAPSIGAALGGALATILIVMRSLPEALPETKEDVGALRAVLFVTIDTLRADHVGAYGYERPTSPRLDEFAKESVLFERAYAPMPSTDPSHVAMLTGQLPRTTGVMANGYPITNPDVSSLASWFRQEGYRTGAITSRAHLNPASLLLPGFDTFSAPTTAARSTEAAEALRRARTWLKRHGDRPFFLWVHFWDPHGPYDPPREAAPTMFVDAYRGRPLKRGMKGGPPAGEPYTKEAFDYAIGLYDGEIRYADEHVGALIDEVRERVGREKVLVVVASDHGETFDEMDETELYAMNHGYWLRRAEVHVPLMFSWPGRLPVGRRVPHAVAATAIAPTIIELAREARGGAAAPPSDVAGLAPLMVGPASVKPETVFLERRHFLSPPRDVYSVPELGVIEGDHLYVVNPEREPILHDVTRDLRGVRNLVRDRRDVAERLARRLDTLRRRYPPTAIDPEGATGDKAAALRGLTYVR